VPSSMDTRPARAPLWSLRGGSCGTLLVLIHGLAATADVWEPVTAELAQRWNGEWLAVDLAGHGRSPHRESYTIGGHAADVADIIGRRKDVVVVGHSLGGAVGLALASGWFGVEVRLTVALGVKIRWSSEELDRAETIAARPPRQFVSRDEAAKFWLRLAGLENRWDADHPSTQPAVTELDGKFIPAFDNRSHQVGAPPMLSLLAAARGIVVLARGANDPMVSDDDIRQLDLPPCVIAHAGHNAHVEAASPFVDIVLDTLSRIDRHDR
jgi:pimeloyl-ACP methyl ester carboxylesterase